MSCFCVRGGVNLRGEINVSGSKNAILPLLSSCLLTSSTVVFHGVPRLRDVDTMIALLRALGVSVRWQSLHSLSLSAKDLTSCVVPLSLVRDMRASILVIGPLLARLGYVEFLEPGGCAIGQRPIDQHLKALSRMGVVFDHLGDRILGSCANLVASHVAFDCVTVTGTENLMMAAALADGVTVLSRAACEPEIVDLAKCLSQMGAIIEGAGTPTIRVKGVSSLSGVEYRVMPDRIETGTYLCAGAATRGEVVLRGACPYLLNDVLDAFRAAGCIVKIYDENTIYIKSSLKLSGVDIVTAPYPGFPTDLQAPFMVVNSVASGFSRVTEKIFEGRFIHVSELQRFGCHISVKGDTACIHGGYLLKSSVVKAPDLRAAAALVIASLCADGTSTIQRTDLIERGYESMPEKLSVLGAFVQLVEVAEQCVPS
ncbi:UDP-N-acetylglucosamine 1-carboxyvinyltransferase [Candidatus Ichthyocystis hellenicum]|uniref:UDP-N-acetylglucosamine 1-carboxyvinyltransferase n=1 Tax=Candidatus Ichthyocystis hellenicum TaxID=1561003 RepID=UPI000B29CAA2|nr:UDP-N-acetylglucosamine 1-carboxyvinyltransferase [Candidatus Ichthyocystis hellenicum]